MNIRRDEISEEELMAIFGPPQDMPKPEVFDLGAEVVLNELTDDELLFRESIIKTFFESATRAGHPIYGFTVEILEKMHAKVVEEFKRRGRDYLPALDRHQKADKKDVKRDAEKGKETIKVKPGDKELKELITEIAEKAAEKVIQKNPVTIPLIQPNPNYPGSGNTIYCGTNYTTSKESTGGDANDETSE